MGKLKFEGSTGTFLDIYERDSFDGNVPSCLNVRQSSDSNNTELQIESWLPYCNYAKSNECPNQHLF